MTDAVRRFEEQRGRLSRLAYRMLGSHADTDDVLQEAFLRWSKADRSDVDSPAALLTTIVTRLCIDRRREIDRRKETYIGPWLPDPIVEAVPPPDRHAEVAESISIAFLYVLERLNPVERAAYLLRKVFNYDYEEIGSILEKTVANCRQLVSRAERRVQEAKPRFHPQPAEPLRISEQFLHACATGDLRRLLQMLSEDVVLVSDGGGKASAALRPILGSDRVARFFLGISRKTPAYATAQPVLVNGAPGFAGYVDGELVTVCSFDIEVGRIVACHIMRNPEKLAPAATRSQVDS